MASAGHFGCRKSLSISFLAISDRCATLFYLEIFDKMAAVGHFGCPKFTLDHISGHFRSIHIFNFFLAKWLPSPILDVQNSLSITFLAISDRSAILDVRNSLSMAFLAISDTYGTLFFFKFLTKWPPAATLDVHK